MLDKHRVLAVTKCDLLDDELIEMLRTEIKESGRQGDKELPVVFISAVANKGLDELKDVLWKELNSESNKLQAITSEDVIVHKDKDMTSFVDEEEDVEFFDIEDIEDIEERE